MTTFMLNEDQRLLARTAREVTRERAPVSQLRKLRDEKHPDGFDRKLWRELCELGFAGLTFPESAGGAGLGHRELGLVLEELGSTLAATPMIASVVLAGNALMLAGGQHQELEAIASGKRLYALAFNERHHHAPSVCATRAERRGDEYVLSGQKRFVLDGHIADRVLVLARTAGAVAEREGLTLFAIDPKTAGVRMDRLGMVDSRNAAHLSLEGVRVSRSSVLGEVDGAGQLLDPVLDRAAIALSAEMLGGARAAFELTLDYLKTRKQFGVLIGTFQALKHRVADLYAELELGRSVIIDALQAIDHGRPDTAQAASIAKARMSEVYVRVAAEAIQLHGGIGVTDEHDIGLYYKRARVSELTFGDASFHRDRYATLRGY